MKCLRQEGKLSQAAKTCTQRLLPHKKKKAKVCKWVAGLPLQPPPLFSKTDMSSLCQLPPLSKEEMAELMQKFMLLIHQNLFGRILCLHLLIWMPGLLDPWRLRSSASDEKQFLGRHRPRTDAKLLASCKRVSLRKSALHRSHSPAQCRLCAVSGTSSCKLLAQTPVSSGVVRFMTLHMLSCYQVLPGACCSETLMVSRLFFSTLSKNAFLASHGCASVSSVHAFSGCARYAQKQIALPSAQSQHRSLFGLS